MAVVTTGFDIALRLAQNPKLFEVASNGRTRGRGQKEKSGARERSKPVELSRSPCCPLSPPPQTLRFASPPSRGPRALAGEAQSTEREPSERAQAPLLRLGLPSILRKHNIDEEEEKIQTSLSLFKPDERRRSTAHPFP